jgi:hypothetical protein
MLLNPISEGGINGTALATILSKIIGGVLISADSTNDATVTLREDGANGKVVFHLVTKTPAFVCAPIRLGSTQLYISCTGTGAKCFVYEWVP